MNKINELVESFNTVCQCARAWLVENGKDELWIDVYSIEIKRILEKKEAIEAWTVFSETKLSPPGDDLIEKLLMVGRSVVGDDDGKAKIRKLLQDK